MPDTQGNVFLTWENLAFSLPLLLTVLVYVYFTMIPLKYGLPALGVLFIIYQIRSQMIAQGNKKLENLDRVLDDKAIQDLIGEEDDESAKAKKEAEIRKQKAKVEARLAQEKKAANKKAAKKSKKKGTEDDDADDEDAMATFAKVSTKKKN